MKRTGLGRDPLSWITSTVPEGKREKRALSEVKPETKKETQKREGTTPKFKTFDVRLTVLLREDQLSFLDKVIREVNKNRAPEYRKERITKNTVLRAFIDAFSDTRFNLKNIADEENLLSRVREMVKK